MSANNCLIIAGEKSGEEHCLSFLEGLKKHLPETTFWGVGGDEMKSQGVELIYHLRDFSSMGFSEVFKKIPFYYNALKKIQELAKQRKTQTAILIDFQDFNLRLAQRLKSQGVNVLYYVAPQAWAWKEHRVKVLEKAVHTLFTIIPFEEQWFKQRGVSKVFPIPHPVFQNYQDELNNLPPKDKNKDFTSIVILPGSRNFEVKHLLPVFMEGVLALSKKNSIKLYLVKSESVNPRHYDSYEKHFDEIFDSNDLPSALKKSDYAVASSGTVTLTTALFEVPTVVAYKSSLLNEFIFYTFLNYTGFISLANIVHQKKLFPEFTQEQVSGYNIQKALEKWLFNPEAKSKIDIQLQKTKDLVGGDTSKVVQRMVEVISRGASNV